MRVDNATLTSTDLEPPPFSASSEDIRINRLLSISLTISLLASFGTLLAQQWISHFKRETHLGFEKDLWEKRRRLDGAQRWHLETIVELVLPTLLQTALIVFMIGLIDLLGTLNHSVALPNLILASLGAFTFIVSIICSIWDPYCPFQTPIPKIILRPLHFIVSRIVHPSIARGIASHIPIPLQRRPESDDVMEAKSICATLETSHDDAALFDSAQNLALMWDRAALQIVGERPEVDKQLERLYRLAGKQGRTRAAVFAQARAHVVLAGPAGWVGHPTILWEEAAAGCLADPTSPLSRLSSSFVAFGMWALCKHLQYGPDVTGEYLDHLCAAFDGAAVRETVTTIGMMAWYLSSSSHPSLRSSDRRGKARATPLLVPRDTPFGLELPYDRSALLLVKTAYTEFREFLCFE